MTTAQPTSTSEHLDRIVAGHSLLEHPFYIAWSMGELPVGALKDYAREYGAFIATIRDGWRAAGNEAVAIVEEHHTRVWDRAFAGALETAIGDPQVEEVVHLVALAGEMFSDPVTALGALYAFESQQPFTAQSKLKGLRDHYGELPAATREYFRLHEADYDEPAILAQRLNALEPADRERAEQACRQMSQALYRALSGIYAAYQK